MEFERDVLGSPVREVPVVEGEVVLAIRALADRGVGSRAIARAVGVARNTVRRYLLQSIRAARRQSCKQLRLRAAGNHRYLQREGQFRAIWLCIVAPSIAARFAVSRF
jgi:transposase-like protein